MQRRQFTYHALKLATIASLVTGATLALAQAFPSKPVTILVAFAAGGPTDTVARAVAQQAAITLGQLPGPHLFGNLQSRTQEVHVALLPV